jgi:outer membrane protein insertion porin family
MSLWVYKSIKSLIHGFIDLLTHRPIDLLAVLSLVSFSLPFLCFGADELPISTQLESPETVRYIRRIVFHGNSAVNDKTLAELLAVRPGQKFNPQLIGDALPRILAEYKKLGYIFAKVEWECRSAEKDQVVLHVNVREGEVVRMGEVELSGSVIFSKDELLDRLDVRRKPFFDDSVFRRDMERLLELYSDNGHPLVKLWPSEFRVENGRLNLKIDIDEGPLVKIDQVEIRGLEKTKEQVVLRELGVKPGDIFNQSEIDESERRLSNMGYFQVVGAGLRPAPTGNDDVILSFSVTEGRTGSFSGVLGYNPSEDEAEGQKFTGVLEAVETNLLGTGRQIAVRGRFGLIDTYEFAYEEPWVLDAPVDIGIRLWGTRQTDALSGQIFGERAASLSGTTRMTRAVEGSLAMTYKQVESPGSTPGSAGISPASSGDLLTGRKYSLTSTLQRDSRDYFINPSTGRLDRASVEVSRGDFKTIRTWLDLNQYFKTWQRQAIVLGLHGARVWGEEIPLTEMLYLGGANTLRGYSEDFFRGEGRLFANCEYRFLVARDSQFFFFLDGGSIYTEENGLSPLKLGYGLGTRLRSQTGLVSVDYGVAEGDSILSGKIHVSLGAAF